MSNSEGATSTKRTRSSVAHSSYLTYRLEPNGIIYCYQPTELSFNAHQIRCYNEISGLLRQVLDESFNLPPSDEAIAPQPSFKTQRNGHRDIDLARTGYRLHASVQELVGASESKWRIFWTSEVWIPLGLTSVCAFTSVLMARTRFLLTSPGQINYGGHMTPN